MKKYFKNKKMHTTHFVILLVFSFMFVEVASQQLPQYTQYNYNMNVVNPAYVGSKKTLKVNMLGRSQWVGVDGAPKTGTLVVDFPVGHKMGAGFSAIHDQVGPLKQTYFYGDVSNSIRVSSSGTLAFGLKAGVSFQNIDTSLLEFNNPESISNLNSIAPNLGFGFYYYEENYYIGLSAPTILSSNLYEVDTNNSVSENSSGTTFFLTTGYLFDLNPFLVFKPSMMLRYSTVFPVSLDLSASLFFNKKFEIGMAYRTNNTVSLTSVLAVKDTFRLGYAYDYSLGNFTNNNSGSHEILLLLDIETKKRRRYSRHTCF